MYLFFQEYKVSNTDPEHTHSKLYGLQNASSLPLASSPQAFDLYRKT